MAPRFTHRGKHMTKEKLQERMKQLEMERRQLEATILSYNGAIQDCQHWIAELDKDQNEQDQS